MPETKIVEVAVDVPIRGTFHYEWGKPLGELPAVGTRLAVPFGRFSSTGYLLGEVSSEEAESILQGRALREVAYIKDKVCLITPEVLELARWIAKHYLAPLGEVLSAFLPRGVKSGARARRVKYVKPIVPPEKLIEVAEAQKRAKKYKAALLMLAKRGTLSARELGGGKSDTALVKKIVAAGLGEIVEKTADVLGAASSVELKLPDYSLTKEQLDAMSCFEKTYKTAAKGDKPHGMLLEGITGSGKTEIYLRAIEQAIKDSKQAIVLVPEIALTSQTIYRFAERFSRLGILHSHLTEGERADQWRKIHAGDVDVVIGARSALFAPLPNLGVIVIDEEHEATYKQDSSPRYQARDVALKRCELENACLILGSATPSLESYQAAENGELAHARLLKRIGDRPLPPVTVVEMAEEQRREKHYIIISRQLETELKKCMANKQQAILFLNRRGHSTFLRCARCGEDIACDKCDVPFVMHKSGGRNTAMQCHYCGVKKPYQTKCPECGFNKLIPLGTGTERVSDEIARILPDVRTERVDTDSMKSHEDYERVLGAFGRGEIDILIGTQIIAKGLDNPNVTLVGIVNADVALNMADFRASERAFGLIAQVAGRAGRGPLGGRVIVQTFFPDSLAVRAGAAQQMQLFALEELKHRKMFAYPPFTRLARVVVEGERPEQVAKLIQKIAQALEPMALGESEHSILGPAEAPLGLIRGKRRQHLIIKAANAEVLEDLLMSNERVLRSSGKTRVILDVDPVNMR